MIDIAEEYISEFEDIAMKIFYNAKYRKIILKMNKQN